MLASVMPPTLLSGSSATSGCAAWAVSARPWPSTYNTTISGSRKTTPPISVVVRGLRDWRMVDLSVGRAPSLAAVLRGCPTIGA